MTRPALLGLCSAALALASAAAAAAGDPVAGAAKAETCRGCHAIPGATTTYPSYRVPRIGGQHAEYLVAALKAYRDGLREHPTMRAQARSLSEQDMADIAAFLAAQGEEER